jgi:ketosteroid isomerase-like protein
MAIVRKVFAAFQNPFVKSPRINPAEVLMAHNSKSGIQAAQVTATEVVQSLFEAFGRGDIAFILDRLTEDCRWKMPAQGRIPVSGEYFGPAGAARFFQTLEESEEIILFEPREFFEKGDDVVVLGTEEMRVRKNGNRARTDWAMLFRLHEGRVAQWEIFFDTDAYARAHEVAL